MGLISWIIFGALAGWVASMITGNDRRQGCLFNIVIGVIGAFLGGIVVEFLTGRGFHFGFNIMSLVGLIYPVVTLVLINTTFKDDLIN